MTYGFAKLVYILLTALCKFDANFSTFHENNSFMHVNNHVREFKRNCFCSALVDYKAFLFNVVKWNLSEGLTIVEVVFSKTHIECFTKLCFFCLMQFTLISLKFFCFLFNLKISISFFLRSLKQRCKIQILSFSRCTHFI